MVIYVNTVDVESLTGPAAIERAVNATMETLRSDGVTTTLAHFKLSSQGITVTDNKHRYPLRDFHGAFHSASHPTSRDSCVIVARRMTEAWLSACRSSMGSNGLYNSVISHDLEAISKLFHSLQTF